MTSFSRRLGVTLTLGFAVALTSSELASTGARGFWADHPVTTSLLTGLVLLFAAIFMVDELIKRREEAKYRRLARQARNALTFEVIEIDRLLSTHFLNFTHVAAAESLPADGIGPRGDQAEDKARALSSSASWNERLWPTATQLARSAESTLTSWSPVLLSNGELTRLANRYAGVVEALRALATHMTLSYQRGQLPPNAGLQLLRVIEATDRTRECLTIARPLTYRPRLRERVRFYFGRGDPTDYEEEPADFEEELPRWYERERRRRAQQDRSFEMPPSPFDETGRRE
jgi:hypothetical protein